MPIWERMNNITQLSPTRSAPVMRLQGFLLRGNVILTFEEKPSRCGEGLAREGSRR